MTQEINWTYTRDELTKGFPDLTDTEWDYFVERMERSFNNTLAGGVHEYLVRNRLEKGIHVNKN